MAQNDHHNDRTRSFMALGAGTLVGHYRIISRIGVGGMGEVYLAEDTELDRSVALKFLSSHLCQDDACRARFRREAQAAAKLDHPNIIHVYEVSEYQGRPFFAMQHVEGQSLKDYAGGKELSLRQILELGIQICDGLREAHDAGVIHRDIKPSNILIDMHGRARIVDFGLASIKNADQLTRTGSTLGTIGYMSPEQVRGDEIDHRSDLFSLGVVLYELIAGRSAFTADTEAATLHAITHETPQPLARYRRDVPDGIQLIIDKALDKDVETRYQNAPGLLADLRRERRQIEISGVVPTAVGAPAAGASRRRWIVAAGIVIVVAVILILTKPWADRATTAHPDKTMLAVLPFENLGASEDEYFADGITHEIISRLAAISELGVISRTSVYTYKETHKTIPQIAAELGVEYVLEGTIRWEKRGDTDKVRITPQLIRVADDMPLWAENYERALTQVFAVQTEIAEHIVDKLGITLGAREDKQLRAIPTANLEAYNLYLKGIYHLGKQTVEGFRQGKYYLDLALAADSNFAHAWAGLAAYHVFVSTSGKIAVRESYPHAKRAAEKALRLDDDLAEAHIVMGWVRSHMEWDWKEADREFRRALELSPGNASAYLAYASYLLPMCRFDEAIAAMERALELDPVSTLVNEALGWVYLLSGHLDRSIAQFKKTLELDPVHVWAHCQLAWAYAFNNMYDEAVQQCDTVLLELQPEFDPWLQATLASIYAMAGRPEMARATIRRLQELPPEFHVDPVCFASLYAALGETDAALDRLDEAYRARSVQMLFLRLPSARDFFFRSISSDERYREIVDRMNFPPLQEGG